jgi:hypothetical protein
MIPVRVRTLMSLARIEAAQLVRSVVVLSGLVAGGAVVWVFVHHIQPPWWNGDWEIGYGQVVLSLMVLIAAQLATARAQRDGMTELYESFPSSAGRRTFAHLLGVLGAVPASLVLIGAATLVFEWRSIVGTPDIAVLVGGILLVLAGGAIGVAIGSRFSHPLAGVLGAFIWFVPFSQSNRFSSDTVWLYPWVKPPQLAQLPDRLAGYPPATSHDVELAAIALLAGFVALAIATAARRQRVSLIAAAALSVVAIVVAGVVQLQPIPTRDLNQLVSETANTGTAQHCVTSDVTSDQVHYCLYPEYGALLPTVSGPIGQVLARVPGPHTRALTVSQSTELSIDDATLTHGQSAQQVDNWRRQLQAAPANHQSSTAIFVNLGAWPVGGQQTDARFDLSLAAADWAVGLPTNTGSSAGVQPRQCVPLNQAREAIAIWLVGQATELPSARFQGTGGGGTPISRGFSLVRVGGTSVVTWLYPGENADYLSSGGPQNTAAGYLLAHAMSTLPADRVAAVLKANWHSLISPHTTDVQLAAALGIAMPAVPSGLIGPRGNVLTPPPGSLLAQPLCTT